MTPIGLKVHDAHGQLLTPIFAALQDADLPLRGEDDNGEAVLEAAHHIIPFNSEAAYLEAVADPDILDDLMGQIVSRDAVFDLCQVLNALARRSGEETFTLEPAVAPVDAAVRRGTEAAITAYLSGDLGSTNGKEMNSQNRVEEQAAALSREILKLVVTRLTPQAFAALRAASGVGA